MHKHIAKSKNEKVYFRPQVISVEALSDKHVLIKLTDLKPLPEIIPGQFLEVQ